MQGEIIIIATFFAYLVVMLVIGIYSYLGTKNVSDYLLGGRRLNCFTTNYSNDFQTEKTTKFPGGRRISD